MRIIDADAFKKDLENQMELLFDTEIAELVDKQPTISQWIPVSERLPNINDSYVIATCKDNIVRRLFYSHDTKDWWCEEIDYYYPIDFVVAWMPWPEPYKKGNSDDRVKLEDK